jgi:hypothetical protein
MPVRHVAGWVQCIDTVYSYAKVFVLVLDDNSAAVSGTGKQVYFPRAAAVRRIPLTRRQARAVVRRGNLTRTLLRKVSHEREQ